MAYPEATTQVRDLVRVAGVADPLPNVGSVFGENLIYRDPGDLCRVHPATPPPAEYDMGEPGKIQGQDRVGIVEGSCG